MSLTCLNWSRSTNSSADNCSAPCWTASKPPDLVAEIDPVRQRGQFVVARQMADPGFRVAAFGDVFEQHDRAAPGHRLEGP